MCDFKKNFMDVISKIFLPLLWGRGELLPLPFNFPPTVKVVLKEPIKPFIICEKGTGRMIVSTLQQVNHKSKRLTRKMK